MDMQQAPSPSSIPPAMPDDITRVLGLDGRADPASDPHLDAELLRRMYKAMVRTRLVDERLTALQRQGRIGFHVGALGEEAAIVASAAAMRPQDWLFPCYREVGAALWRGLKLQTYVDNMYGNANDVVQGRQMPDHVTSRDAHFGSVTAPIGTQIPQAVGFAWGAKIRKEDLVTGVYFGDGATSSNDFHSGMNFAGVFKAPTVFLLRNNGWAISVPASKQTAVEKLSDKGKGYGVRAVRCDGNDAIAVYAVVREAVEHASAGHGPTLVELLTYRLGAHSTSDDPRAYRDDAEVEAARRRDPLTRMRSHLEQRKLWTEQDQQAWEQEVHQEMSACIERAENAPKPPLSSMFRDVYATQPAHLQDQERECVEGPRYKSEH